MLDVEFFFILTLCSINVNCLFRSDYVVVLYFQDFFHSLITMKTWQCKHELHHCISHII